jgi:HK97 family phage prohead protease
MKMLLVERRGTTPLLLPADIARRAEEAAKVQTLIFAKAKYPDQQAAIDWATAHEFVADKVDETEDSFRIRQFDPGMCAVGSEATIDIEDGIKAVTCMTPAANDARRDIRSRLGVIRSFDEDKNRIGGYASFRSVDRHEELVLPSAFEKRLDIFKRHPVMLLGHEHDASTELPIGKWDGVELGADGLRVEGPLLKEHRRYHEVRAAARDGLLALSIGFYPLKWRDATDEEQKEFGGAIRRVVEEVELLEVSLVSIGSNRDTLAELRSMAVAESRRAHAQPVEGEDFARAIAELRSLRVRPVGEKNEAVMAALAKMGELISGMAVVYDEIRVMVEGGEPMPPSSEQDAVRALLDGLIGLKSSLKPK